jgi:hypothetical protein
MFSIETFTQTRPEKIIIFILLSLLSGGILLFSPPSDILPLLLLSIGFFTGSVLVGFLAKNIAFALAFPFLFFLLTQTSQISGPLFWSAIFFGISGLLTAGNLYYETKNMISLRFFSTSKSGIASGFLFFLLAVLTLFFSQVSLPEVVKKYTASLPIETISEKFIDQVENPQTQKSLNTTLESFMIQQTEAKIQALCEGNKSCIERQKKAVKQAIQARLENTDIEISDTQKQEFQENISQQIEGGITKFLDPAQLEKLTQEYFPNSFLSELSGESLQKILALIFFFFLLLPFQFIFIWILAAGVSLLFFIFLASGIVRINTKEARKEFLY